MATHAPITGAPTRAPIIISFPDTPIARARRELLSCHNKRMLDRWLSRVQRVDSGLSEGGYVDLTMRGLERGRLLAAAGVR